jgi:hypothetical protein
VKIRYRFRRAMSGRVGLESTARFNSGLKQFGPQDSAGVVSTAQLTG